MFDNGLGFARVRDIFAEMSEGGAEAAAIELAGSGDGVVQSFARHKARDAFSDESVAAGAFFEPVVLCSCEDYRTGRAHRFPFRVRFAKAAAPNRPELRQ